MYNKAFNQTAKLASATCNLMASLNPENFSQFLSERVKTQIEYSLLPDNKKERLKSLIDIGHEWFGKCNTMNPNGHI